MPGLEQVSYDDPTACKGRIPMSVWFMSEDKSFYSEYNEDDTKEGHHEVKLFVRPQVERLHL